MENKIILDDFPIGKHEIRKIRQKRRFSLMPTPEDGGPRNRATTEG
jgi:hypothetical protein